MDASKTCPMCGRRLPHCRRTKFNSDKSIGIIERKCRCGMLVVDTVTRKREYFRKGKGGLAPWVPFGERAQTGDSRNFDLNEIPIFEPAAQQFANMSEGSLT